MRSGSPRPESAAQGPEKIRWIARIRRLQTRRAAGGQDLTAPPWSATLGPDSPRTRPAGGFAAAGSIRCVSAPAATGTKGGKEKIGP